MRVYVSGLVQHSIFSSGYHTTTLQVAAALEALGHDVCIVNVAGNKATWFDDCPKGRMSVVQKEDFIGPNASLDCIGGVIKGDLLIDVIGSMTGPERTAIARRTVLFVRHPDLITEIECTVYPMATMRRCYDGLTEIWSWDFYSQDNFTVLAILGRCRVRAVPFVWSPKFLDAFVAENGIVPWHVAAPQGAGWICRVAETNASNRSNCTIPLVALRQVDGIQQTIIHNAGDLSQRPFFKENVQKHCKLTPEALFVGRNRVPEWCMQPRSFLFAHCRFTPLRPLYLDAAYMGIPMIHNSTFMRQFGAEFESYYYANNSITDARAAMKRLFDDYSVAPESFAARLQRVRNIMIHGLTVMRAGAQEAWTAALREVAEAGPPGPALAPVAAPITTYAASPKKTFRVQFIGMWDRFQASYNFFTLLLEAYFKAQGRDVAVEGHDSKYMGDLDLRIMGPFPSGEMVKGGVPTVFTTAENMPPLGADSIERNCIKLQLGFGTKESDSYMRLPLWMMSINWFGADNDRLVNPRLIPLEYVMGTQGTVGRPKFCSFVVTNPNNPVRNAALDLMGRVGHVDSAGRYRNNCGEELFAGLGGGGGEEKKVAWLRQYRFSITYENSMGDGYVTEKLFHAKAAGCVPIYWGDADAAAADFDASGYIVANGKTDEELVAEVRRLEADEAAYIAMASKPLLTVEKAEAVRRRLAAVAAAIVRVSLFEDKGVAVEALGQSVVPSALGQSVSDIKPATKKTVRESYGRNYA